MPPGLDNPLGARALYIFQNGEDTLYRLHGSPEWNSIGKSVSSGCVRLMNQDIIDLYDRVPDKAPILVTSGVGDVVTGIDIRQFGRIASLLEPLCCELTTRPADPIPPSVRLPRMPRTIARPTDDPTERTTDLIAASATVWRFGGRGAAAAARLRPIAAGSCQLASPPNPGSSSAAAGSAAGRWLLPARAALCAFGGLLLQQLERRIRGRPSCRTGRRPGSRP